MYNELNFFACSRITDPNIAYSFSSRSGFDALNYYDNSNLNGLHGWICNDLSQDL